MTALTLVKTDLIDVKPHSDYIFRACVCVFEGNKMRRVRKKKKITFAHMWVFIFRISSHSTGDVQAVTVLSA